MKLKTRLSIIVLGLAIITVLGQKFLILKDQHQRVDAAGKVIFTFNGLPPNAPVFSVNDFKPGDCYDRVVTAKNTGSGNAQINLQSLKIINPNHLDQVLSINISQNNGDVYGGGVGDKNLTQFFIDSQNPKSIPLALIKAGKTKTFHLKVCMPKTVGNEYQATTLKFDIAFGVNPYSCNPGNLIVNQANNITLQTTINVNSATGNNQIVVTNSGGLNILARDIQECCSL
jgi:hypothetical protein